MHSLLTHTTGSCWAIGVQRNYYTCSSSRHPPSIDRTDSRFFSNFCQQQQTQNSQRLDFSVDRKWLFVSWEYKTKSQQLHWMMVGQSDKPFFISGPSILFYKSVDIQGERCDEQTSGVIVIWFTYCFSFSSRYIGGVSLLLLPKGTHRDDDGVVVVVSDDDDAYPLRCNTSNDD